MTFQVIHGVLVLTKTRHLPYRFQITDDILFLNWKASGLVWLLMDISDCFSSFKFILHCALILPYLWLLLPGLFNCFFLFLFLLKISITLLVLLCFCGLLFLDDCSWLHDWNDHLQTEMLTLLQSFTFSFFMACAHSSNISP